MLAGTRDAARDKWFDDRDVVAITKAILDVRDANLIRWAKEATLADNRSQVANEFRLRDPRIRKAANQISTAGARICARSPGDRSHLIGAVVERIAYTLVAGRTTQADRERKVSLGGSTTSNHIEVVVDDDPFEAYECKYSALRINQADLNQLASIHVAAGRNGRRAVVGVVTLDSWRTLQGAVSGLTISSDIRHACASDLLELGDGPASRRLSKTMSASHLGM